MPNIYASGLTAILTKGPGEHERLASCDPASEGESHQRITAAPKLFVAPRDSPSVVFYTQTPLGRGHGGPRRRAAPFL